jgi:hypothetical protein
MIEHFCKWLESTPLSVYCAATSWIVPTVQSIHILGVCAAFASMSMLSLRLLGVWGRRRPVAAIALPVLSWLWPALGVLLLTGIVMVLAEPERELLNVTFRLKMALVAVAAVSGWALRGSLARRPQHWDFSVERAAVKPLALALFVLWAAIVVCGRWIAYTQ